MKKRFGISFFITVISFIILFSGACLAAGGRVTLEAENTPMGIRLQWTECDGAYYYEVYRQTSKDGKKLLLSKVQNTFYDDTSAVDGKNYRYTVIPVFATYSTAKESEPVTAYRLSAATISKGSSQRNGINIKWKGVKNAEGYRVYRKSAEDTEWSSIAKLGAKARSFLDEEISPGMHYSYCVKPFAGKFEGAAANEKQLSYISYPELKSIENTENGIYLSWEETSDAAYYIVYRKTGENGSFKAIALLDAGYTGYEDKSAASGKLCTYYVRAADSDGNKGSYDRELSVKYVKKSVITAAVNAPKGIKLFWSKSEGCQGYAIYRKALGEKDWKLRGTVYGENRLSAVDSKVEDSKIYLYTVRAFKDRILAVYDEKGIALRFYPAPEGLKVKKSAENGREISWDKVDGVKNYAVYRKEGDDSWALLGITSENTFTDKTAKPKKKYTYGVEVYAGSVLKSAMAEITSK